MATYRTIRAQRLAQFNNETTPIRTNHGVYPPCSPDQINNEIANVARSHRPCTARQTTSSNRHLTCPRTHDQGKKHITTVLPLFRRTKGLARWEELIYDASHDQIGPKTIWPLQNFQGTIPRGISADTPSTMETKKNPRRIPC